MLRELRSLMSPVKENKSLSTSSTTVNVHTDLLVCLFVKERFRTCFVLKRLRILRFKPLSSSAFLKKIFKRLICDQRSFSTLLFYLFGGCRPDLQSSHSSFREALCAVSVRAHYREQIRLRKRFFAEKCTF